MEIRTTNQNLRDIMYDVFCGRCFYSGRKLNRGEFHIDHVLPKMEGGLDIVENYVLCSPDINTKKSNNIDIEMIDRILYIVKTTYSPRVIEKLKAKNKEKEKRKNRSCDKIGFRQPKVTNKRGLEVEGIEFGDKTISIIQDIKTSLELMECSCIESFSFKFKSKAERKMVSDEIQVEFKNDDYSVDRLVRGIENIRFLNGYYELRVDIEVESFFKLFYPTNQFKAI